MTAPSPEHRLDLSHAITSLSDVVLRGEPTSALLQRLIDPVAPALGADRAFLYDAQPSVERVGVLAEWTRPGVSTVSAADAYPLQRVASAARELAASGAAIQSSRTATHPILARDGAAELLHKQQSVERLLWFPFRHRSDGYHLLVLHQVDEDRGWSADDLAIAAAVAAQIELAVMRLELLHERERAEDALHRSDTRFRLFYDHTPSMFFTVDSAGIVRNVNRFGIKHLGYSAADMVGRSVLQIVHPQDHPDVRGHLATCFADPGVVRTISFRKVCKDGSIIWVKEALHVADTPDGPRAFIVCEDVTAARAHEEAARRAESKAHERDEFMAMLGHELRNPLSPIVTALEILRSNGNTEPELEVIDRQVAHLRRLVDDLLDVSRITRGKVELHKELVELSVVVSQAVEVARPLFHLRRQHLHVDVPATGLVVYADPSRLVQVFVNLLTNAAKYSAEEQEVFFSAERRRHRLIVQVRDKGEGIEPQMLERVFDLFAQRPQPVDRSQSGLGLGLTIVRNLITLHGGTVRASSPGRGEGSTFEVDLPAAAEPLTTTTTTTSGPAQRTVPVGPGRSILVVDDNDDVRKSLVRLLTLHGYEVTGAGDGPSALRAAAELKPRVVLVDIGLPGMDGYELARQLRRSDAADTRLFAITGYGQASDRARSRDAGFDAHLVKPVDLQTLLPLLD